MAQFGTASKDIRDQCHPALRRVLDEAIKYYDFSVIWGYRDCETQNRMFDNGTSLLRYPDSKHNWVPARAFDVIPYPKGFEATDKAFYKQATYIYRAASTCGVQLVWGGHWRTLKDLAHFQLAKGEW